MLSSPTSPDSCTSVRVVISVQEALHAPRRRELLLYLLGARQVHGYRGALDRMRALHEKTSRPVILTGVVLRPSPGRIAFTPHSHRATLHYTTSHHIVSHHTTTSHHITSCPIIPPHRIASCPIIPPHRITSLHVILRRLVGKEWAKRRMKLISHARMSVFL